MSSASGDDCRAHPETGPEATRPHELFQRSGSSAQRAALMPRRRQPTTDAAPTTNDAPVPRSREPRRTRPHRAHHQRPAGVGMKRLLSGAETALPPARAAPHHPQQHDASWHIEPQRPRTPPTLGSRLDDDLELPFQRGEADLVGKLGDPHQPHAQAAGFLCSAQVASTTGRQPLPARIDELQGSHRPQPPPALRERLPATDAHRAALVACHHGGANQHQGPSPLKSLHLPPAPPCARALQNTQGSRGQGVRSTCCAYAAQAAANHRRREHHQRPISAKLTPTTCAQPESV